MKTRTAANLLLLFILLLPAYAASAGLGELRLSHLEGDVLIRTVDTSEWSPAVINFPLRDGDQLWVPEEGLAEIESRRGSVIRLNERTAFDILAVDNDALQFYLDLGMAYVNARGERETTLQLDTPLSSVRVYERAKFNVDVSNNGEADISVFEGEILAESRKGQTMVEAGNMLSMGEDWADLSPLGRPDEWERMNHEQDRKIEERRKSVRYLPEELAGYSSDFDDNGEWVDLPSHGYVWRPRVQISVDWSPYHNGRWVWIGNDYVWIANESWGWAPYHYGRWSFVARYGWCWVPPPRHEVYWGPGYVGWVHTSTYVAWVPLAPREVYYGHGYYGPNSVDITHVDVNTIVVNNVYKNVSVDNSVTIVHNDTFLQGKQVQVKVKGNPFLKEKISVGRPRIRPVKATMMPSFNKIPPTKEPPDKFKSVRIGELQKQRPLVKARDKSVFSREKAPRRMVVGKKRVTREKDPRKAEFTTGENRKSLQLEREKRNDTPLTPGLRKSPPQQSAPSTDIKTERQQKPRSEMKNVRQPTHGNQKSQPPSAPSLGKKQQSKQKPQSETKKVKQPIRGNEDGGKANKQAIQPVAPREDIRPRHGNQKSQPPSAPSLGKKQQSKQKPQSETKKVKQPVRGNEDGGQAKQQATPPASPKEEKKPVPVVTKKGAKGEKVAPDDRKKGKQKHSSETEVVPRDPEAYEEYIE